MKFLEVIVSNKVSKYWTWISSRLQNVEFAQRLISVQFISFNEPDVWLKIKYLIVFSANEFEWYYERWFSIDHLLSNFESFAATLIQFFS